MIILEGLALLSYIVIARTVFVLLSFIMLTSYPVFSALRVSAMWDRNYYMFTILLVLGLAPVATDIVRSPRTQSSNSNNLAVLHIPLPVLSYRKTASHIVFGKPEYLRGAVLHVSYTGFSFDDCVDSRIISCVYHDLQPLTDLTAY